MGLSFRGERAEARGINSLYSDATFALCRHLGKVGRPLRGVATRRITYGEEWASEMREVSRGACAERVRVKEAKVCL